MAQQNVNIDSPITSIDRFGEVSRKEKQSDSQFIESVSHSGKRIKNNKTMLTI